MKLNVTENELNMLICMRDDLEAMAGGGDSDDDWLQNIKIFDKMIKKNKIKLLADRHEKIDFNI